MATIIGDIVEEEAEIMIEEGDESAHLHHQYLYQDSQEGTVTILAFHLG